jgi:restriction system protein
MSKAIELDDMPRKEDILSPLLRTIQNSGGRVKPQEAVNKLADHFRLTEDQRTRLNPSGTNNMFYNRVNWARLQLVKEGLLSDEYYGVWVITDAGRAKAIK